MPFIFYSLFINFVTKLLLFTSTAISPLKVPLSVSNFILFILTFIFPDMSFVMSFTSPFSSIPVSFMTALKTCCVESIHLASMILYA